jgi:hypothetical protein
MREKIEIKMLKFGWAAAVAKKQNTYLSIKSSGVQVLLLLQDQGGRKW